MAREGGTGPSVATVTGARASPGSMASIHAGCQTHIQPLTAFPDRLQPLLGRHAAKGWFWQHPAPGTGGGDSSYQRHQPPPCFARAANHEAQGPSGFWGELAIPEHEKKVGGRTSSKANPAPQRDGPCRTPPQGLPGAGVRAPPPQHPSQSSRLKLLLGRDPSLGQNNMPEHARAAPLHGLRSQRKIPHIGSLCFRKDAVKKQKKYSQTKAIGPTPRMGLEKLAQNISHFLQSSGRVKKEKKKKKKWRHAIQKSLVKTQWSAHRYCFLNSWHEIK